MTIAPLPDLRGVPFYAEPATYLALGDRFVPWEFNGWKQESMSWKTGCYIHAGLSDNELRFRGPDARRFFASICSNSFKTFSPGAMKHAVMCTDAGLIATHGILHCYDENDYGFFAGGPWPVYQMGKSGMRVECQPERSFLFQVAGPTSRTVLEKVFADDIGDIAFLKSRTFQFKGHDVLIGRLGMSGNLAYEVRGPLAFGAELYDAIYKAGLDHGIQRLGWRTYLVNHVEGGFPQQNWTFQGGGWEEPTFVDFVPAFRRQYQITGSVDPMNMRARYRTPFELGWDRAVRFDHDFVGRSALEQEALAPKRMVATLTWSHDDVMDIFRSLTERGEEYKTIDLPTSPTWTNGVLAHADHVSIHGKNVGYSSGTIYSYYFRQFMSMAIIDREFVDIGQEVSVHWGDHGGRIKEVRATIERFPYLNEGRNTEV